MQKHKFRGIAMCAAFAILLFGLARPASAFYLEMPQALKDLFALAKSDSTRAQDGGTMGPMNPPPSQPAPQPGPGAQYAPGPDASRSEPMPGTYNPPSQPQYQPTGDYKPMDNYQPQYQPMPTNENQQQPQYQPMNRESADTQNRMEYQPTNMGATCNVNGTEMPGPCSSYNDNRGSGDNTDGRQNDQGQQERMNNERANNENQKQRDEERGFNDMKRGMKQMDSNLKRFEKMVVDLEKKGGQVPQDLKDKITKAKSISDSVKKATTAEEMQNANMEEYQEIMQTLEESRQEIFESAQRLQDIKRNIKGMEQNLKNFEKQLSKLLKQKIVLPAEISEKVKNARAAIDAIKNAKTWAEVESAGLDDLQGTFQSLDESRRQLEMLSRWPETLKQLNRELAKLNKELKRDKTIVDKLVKKGIDLSSNYTLFAEAVAKLQSVRDEAVAKIAEGNAEEAFDILENGFFGQMEDVWENSKVIQIMSNLGRFSQDFKRGMAEMNSLMTKLKRKKIDITELSEIANQMKEKGNEIIAMIKNKEIDHDSIISELSELESLGAEFDDKVQELTGESGEMPWEKGPKQFQDMKMSPELDKYMTRKPQMDNGTNPIGESNPQPSPGPKLCVPPDCSENPGMSSTNPVGESNPQPSPSPANNML